MIDRSPMIIGRINQVTIAIFPKVIYSFNATPMKLSSQHFREIQQFSNSSKNLLFILQIKLNNMTLKVILLFHQICISLRLQWRNLICTPTMYRNRKTSELLVLSKFSLSYPPIKDQELKQKIRQKDLKPRFSE